MPFGFRKTFRLGELLSEVCSRYKHPVMKNMRSSR
jgi:hypothetical protein